jgi:tetratricopeptide (TPR) repeat protein
MLAPFLDHASFVSKATSYLNKARSLQAMGDYKAALTAYKKARQILEDTVGRKHPTTAATYCSLASLYQAKKEYSKSLDMYSRALKYYEAACPGHFSTARVYCEMGSVLHDRNEPRDLQKALSILQRARAIQEASLDPLHPTLATTYLNLGRVMKTQKDYDTAMVMYQKALKIQEEVLGLRHPTTASTYSSVASLLAVQDKPTEALAMYQTCLTIQMKALGREHPMTVRTQRKMEKVLKK